MEANQIYDSLIDVTADEQGALVVSKRSLSRTGWNSETKQSLTVLFSKMIIYHI
ncbi:hypothetical protein [Nocardia tengchongensis]|uniref:hypothetical protein n=1 Tax=Nocardia tengchongensis TaxID=2055889 RepID=UPI00364F48A8